MEAQPAELCTLLCYSVRFGERGHHASPDPSDLLQQRQVVTGVFAPRPLYSVVHEKISPDILLICHHNSDLGSNDFIQKSFP